ncbi:putative procollagen-lysine2C2-oxoglutarate dioxygenase [Acanthamoeba polyphaga mimivirus]|uniref:Putative procollagen-lysine2-oxoglutarate dioxygenase n=1 Tax=Acanthamoeba polyphaga mimivirus TaxID=212035 RepID=A0A0G2Y8N3_MIMIV|nr:putative procollagen-lysine2-oxoglutarate dioxygenase [Acanthamoeba polyphaga mimivirus]QTF49637.1 putative procollagen-lysine2C2-oxoglutarate dioxygenase [Mimivirus reunion]WMV62080.1 putative procollagen-lysine2C2-oxoglutarate dioxygenase [Mimivirus sp.]WMV63057.1 putative procollagen-lysine2C2-oxoglutarate dioxygenase [Acanthamoeba polyphaga mimivirus]WMV64034.1 putative procollagen-lysine2C2-oxoglutarate dioxygenase [Mimivirus sp.]
MEQSNNDDNLLVLGIGISVHKTDGVLRFEKYCQAHNLQYMIVGEGKKWNGGNLESEAGGGQKINELLTALESIKDNKLIVVCDTYDLIPLSGPEEILRKYRFLTPDNKVVFSSELYCWPDASLVERYPKVDTKYKYLNSGAFMGYRDDIYEMIKNGVKDRDDDQLFFSIKFIETDKIVLDYKCELFQAMYRCNSDLVVHKNRIFNGYTNSYPVFAHGNGPAKKLLNHMEGYFMTEPIDGSSNTINTFKLDNEPKVFFALYVDSNDLSALKQFLGKVASIQYGNKVIYLYDRSDNEQNRKLIQISYPNYHTGVTKYVFDDFKKSDAQFYFLLEQNCIITKKDILHELIMQVKDNHRVISPMIGYEQNSTRTNFWGDIEDGYYKRSENYLDLAKHKVRGLWNVPYVYGVILMHESVVRNWDLSMVKYNDRDMDLCFSLRKHTIFMYMINNNNYGYMV